MRDELSCGHFESGLPLLTFRKNISLEVAHQVSLYHGSPILVVLTLRPYLCFASLPSLSPRCLVLPLDLTTFFSYRLSYEKQVSPHVTGLLSKTYNHIKATALQTFGLIASLIPFCSQTLTCHTGSGVSTSREGEFINIILSAS